MRISDWSSDVCSSDLRGLPLLFLRRGLRQRGLAEEAVGAQGDQRRGRSVALGRAEEGAPFRHGERKVTGLAAHRLSSRWMCVGLFVERSRCRRVTKAGGRRRRRSEEHTSELQSLMRISYAVYCLK